MSNTFAGMSMLRPKKDKAAGPKPTSEEAKRLQAYLAQQYGDAPGDAPKPKKKKKKKEKFKEDSHQKRELEQGAVRIIDTDVTGFEPLSSSFAHGTARRKEKLVDVDEHGEDEVEDAPVVANPEEAEALRRQAEQERELLLKGTLSAWETVEVGGNAAQNAQNDLSPSRRRGGVRHVGDDDNGDASPPRRRAARHDSDNSDDGDASPPRRRAQRHDSDDGDASPPRRRAQRHDSDDGDASPPRRRAQRHDSDNGDAWLPRRKRKERQEEEEDLSPPRRHPSHLEQTEAAAAAEEEEMKKRVKMSDGTTSGMVSGREIQQEMARKREAEARRFAALGAEVTGRHAKTVYRDKMGKQLTKEEYVEAKELERRAGKPQYDEESKLAWGGGLRQKAEREEEERRMREEATKAFARGVDEEYDAAQRERVRWGDPMAHLASKKKNKYGGGGEGGNVSVPDSSLVAARHLELKSSGFVIPLEVPRHSWLRRGVGAPPNRYGITPGRHWDGVDRSNGFERDMFKRQTELRRREQEAHMMNQGDM